MNKKELIDEIEKVFCIKNGSVSFYYDGRGKIRKIKTEKTEERDDPLIL